MTPQKEQQLKSVIVEAVPSIMELKFGCEVYVKGLGSATVLQVFDYRIECSIWNNDANDSVWLIDDDIKKILGRPITLADVLMLNLITGGYQYVVGEEGHFLEMRSTTEIGLMTYEGTGIYWNLADNNLDKQTPETKQWLYDLLVKKLNKE